MSKSQYPGTTKDSVCSRCNRHLNNLNREQQDQHEENHRKEDIEASKQKKLF